MAVTAGMLAYQTLVIYFINAITKAQALSANAVRYHWVECRCSWNKWWKTNEMAGIINQEGYSFYFFTDIAGLVKGAKIKEKDWQSVPRKHSK